MGGDEDELIVMSKKNCNFVPKRKVKSPGFRRLEAVSILELLSIYYNILLVERHSTLDSG